MAVRLLRRRGLQIVDRNLRLKGGEIDLLARFPDGDLLLVEVRGRRTASYRPSLCISPAKLERLRRLAVLVGRARGAVVRIELIEIVGEPGDPAAEVRCLAVEDV